MRNDELKHYGVKGMKWRNHKYVVRDGNDGDYGYNYGNAGSSAGQKWRNAYNKAASVANTYRSPGFTPVQQRHSRKRSSGSGTRTTASTKKPVQQKFGVINRSSRTDRRVTQNLYGDRKLSAIEIAANKAKSADNYTAKKNRQKSKKSDRRVTRDRTGDRKLSAVEIAANKARNADNYTAKKNRQTRQKAKNSAEVRAKTLGEALGKVGRSASANNPMARQKTKARLNKSVQDTAGKITSSAKRSASSKRKKDEQRKLNNERLKKVMNKMQANVEKHNAAVRRRRQIENAKKWVNSKLNDAGKFVNDRKKDAGKFINSAKKNAEKTYNKVTKPRTKYTSGSKKYTTKKNNGYERTFGKGSNKWIKEAKPTKLSNFLNEQFVPKVGTAKRKKKKKK